MANIIYVSTNEMWGGSEELWVRSAMGLKQEGHNVFYCTKYFSKHLSNLNGKNLITSNLPHLFFKLYTKLLNKGNPFIVLLDRMVSSFKPELIVISQGNNIQSLDVISYCIKKKIKFLIITQLVTEAHFGHINHTNLSSYQHAYSRAEINCFVSKKNLLLNNVMIGCELENALVVQNPCKCMDGGLISYPTESTYKVALVGRIECFHKGYDILLQVLSLQKWKDRNILFSIYGDGPHTELLKENISFLKITNLVFAGFCLDLSEIWKNNHILCMPSRMEGQALALIEAMFYGRTAVLTDVGGTRELIEDGINGFIAKAATVEFLDEALERAWLSRNKWEEMGALCRTTIVERYPERAETNFNSLIKKILSR